MYCYFFCFNDKNLDKNYLLKLVENIQVPYQIVTNNLEIHEFFIKKGKESKQFVKIIEQTDHGAKKSYFNARKIWDSYKEIFNDLIYKNIKIFSGLEYKILLQLMMMFKTEKFLGSDKNIIFIFERIQPSYFAILKLAEQYGFKTENRIGILKSNKVKYEYVKKNDGLLNYSETETKSKAIQFVKNQFTKEISVENYINLIKFMKQILLFQLKKLNNKNKTNEILKNEILEKINDKIPNSSNFEKVCLIFVSAVRIDLFFRPIIPIISELKKMKYPFLIITGDYVTSSILSKEKIEHVNLYDEIKILEDNLKNSQNGKELRSKVTNKIKKNKIIGLDELASDILGKMFRVITLIEIFDFIFNNCKINSILEGGSTEIFERVVVELAKENKIKSYSFIPSPPTPNPEYAHAWNADRIFLEGNQGMEVMKELFYDEKKLLITGGTRYDRYDKVDHQESKEILKNKNKIRGNGKIIVIAMSRWQNNDEIWMSKFIKFCNKNNYEIVIKIHPLYLMTSRNVNKNKINFINKECKNQEFSITDDIDLTKLLSASDLVITDWSTVGFEAILLGRPLVQVKFTGEEIESSVQYYKFNAAILVEKYNKLEEMVLEILEDNKHVGLLNHGRENIILEYNYLNDGKAAKRITKVLINNKQ